MTTPSWFSISCLAALIASLGGIDSVWAQDKVTPLTELELLQLSGKPITLTDLHPEPVDDSDNAAVWLARADAGRLAIDMALAESFNFDATLTEAFIKKYQATIADHPDTYDWIHQAAATGQYVPQSSFDQRSFEEFFKVHDPSVMRSYARVLMYRAAVELAEGRTDPAVRSVVAMLQLSRLPNCYFGMQGFLTRKALQGMGTAMLSQVIDTGKVTESELLKEIQNELANHDSLDDLVATIDSERVMGIRLMRDQGMVIRIESYLRTMRLVQERLAETIAERPALFADDDDARPQGVTAAQLMPGIQQIRSVAHRQLDQIRRLRIQVAFLQNPDARSIDDLDLPATSKTDPRTGEPLVVDRPSQ